MPFYPNSDLQNYLIKHSPSFEERLNMFLDVLVGLHQLHSRFIIHRDIKLKNIFVTSERTCVIGDLGIATTALDSATSEVGTYCFNAPEIYSKEGPYGEKIDVFAVGIIAYQLFNSKRNNKIPFPFLEPTEMLKEINKYGYEINYQRYFQLTREIYPCDEDLPAEIRTMIERMLDNDPLHRIGWLALY